ncbi:acyltransferase [Methylobacter sp. G7]|uniref:acyltransferase family protein n=1 Tax=Methylobacter sp. G7 TaxID=3230117 RepID=UPI003D800259
MGLCFFFANNIQWLLPERYYLESSTQRHQGINGIRSILALSVFMHHAVITYYFYQHGRWEVPPSSFYTLLGQVPVGIFFSITGFLFWEKAIHSAGRVSYKKLMISRVKRIAPAYMLAATIILGIVAWESKLTVVVSNGELIEKTLEFLFGIGFLSVQTVNNIHTAVFGSSVFWTLRYEWKFYIALPLIAIFLRNIILKRTGFVLLVAYFLYKISFYYSSMPMIFSFLPGMISAHLYNNNVTRNILSENRFLPFIGAVALICIFTFSSTMYNYFSLFFMCIFFISLVHMETGSLVYKLLQTRSAKLLGSISYSTYIIHCIILYLSFYMMNMIYPIKQFNELQFWMFITSIALFLVAVSALSYRYVEYPFLNVKKKFDIQHA